MESKGKEKVVSKSRPVVYSSESEESPKSKQSPVKRKPPVKPKVTPTVAPVVKQQKLGNKSGPAVAQQKNASPTKTNKVNKLNG